MTTIQTLNVPPAGVPTDVVHAAVYFGIGSMDDAPSKLGTAHFLEHLMYFELVETLKAAGQTYIIETAQATTYRNGMEFSFNFLCEDAAITEKCLLSLLKPPCVDEATFERERAILRRELIEEESDPDFESGQREAAWLYANPLLSRRNSGSPESIGDITLEDILALHKLALTDRPRLVVATDGWNPTTQAVEYDGQAIFESIDDVATHHSGRRLAVPQRDGDPTIVLKTFGNVASFHDSLGLYLAHAYLDEKLRLVFDGVGLAYYFGTDSTSLGDTVELTLYASVDRAELAVGEKHLQDALQSMVEISEDEYISMRAQVVKSFRLSSNDPSDNFDRIAFQASRWGGSIADYEAESKQFGTYSYADFCRIVASFGIRDKAVFTIIRG